MGDTCGLSFAREAGIMTSEHPPTLDDALAVLRHQIVSLSPDAWDSSIPMPVQQVSLRGRICVQWGDWEICAERRDPDRLGKH